VVSKNPCAPLCVHLCGRRIHDAFTWVSLA
jgi:hypothetical protein